MARPPDFRSTLHKVVGFVRANPSTTTHLHCRKNWLFWEGWLRFSTLHIGLDSDLAGTRACARIRAFPDLCTAQGCLFLFYFSEPCTQNPNYPTCTRILYPNPNSVPRPKLSDPNPKTQKQTLYQDPNYATRTLKNFTLDLNYPNLVFDPKVVP